MLGINTNNLMEGHVNSGTQTRKSLVQQLNAELEGQ